MREEFRQARDTAQALKNKEKLLTSINAVRNLKTTQRIIFELKESNRILHEKLQECHKHYKRAVHENDNLLEAVRKYKDALAVRNVEVERYIKRLRVRCSVEVVGHVITKQLQETRDILSATYKRLNNVSICSGDRGTRQQADNYIHQIESVSERWGRVLAKFHELQQEILDKLSRGYNETENQQPSWVLDVKQQCSSLRVKARIVSRTFRDLMNILVRQMQLQENGKSGSTVGSKTEDDVSILNCVELIHGDHLAILDKRLEKLEHDILQHISSSKSAP
ncbi:hypothetical protein PsorP6_001645 [Peronosclerospora sorghi]|uniref:Uncharacterized protein n=1 Tax=Peronosclerospora sorghi TaxID=230839 RepID=A0ACC0WSD5_9STRA|nr:hypothetical protein PsorP6_001645 [Peronosclerospora sorghi]